MKKALYLSLIALSGALPAYAADHSDSVSGLQQNVVMAAQHEDAVTGARNFIEGMAQKGIDFLGNEKLTQEQRREEFRKLLQANYDMKTIGRFALGTYWRSATPKQQAEYQKLFEKMIIKVYSDRFSEYKGQQLEVSGARKETETDIIVMSQVVSQGGEPIQVDWRVRKREGRYKVIDVIVEGVSMAMTQRSDFSSVIQRGGGDVGVLLTHLRGG